MPRTETWLGSSPLPPPPREVEKQWIHACELHDSFRRLGDTGYPSPPNLVVLALDRAIASGILTTGHLAVLVLAAKRGRPPAIDCAIAYRLWTEAMEAIAADCARGTVQ